MSKGKIGIATFHCAENYGAFLQAFALQKWLQESLAVDVKIINYRPEYLIEPYRIKVQQRIDINAPFFTKCKCWISFFTEIPYRLIKKMRYKQAQGLLSLTDSVFNDLILLDDSYKALVLGSDQIWNTNLTNGVDRVYFGTIASAACKKIAYAASVGLSEYPSDIKSEIKTYLSQLDWIGVREMESMRILQPLCDSKIVLNIDPTMLVLPDFWKRYVKKIKHSDYILVYRVSKDTRLMQEAYRIAKKQKKMILHFGDPSVKPFFSEVKVKSLAYCGPFEFISYIAGASIVLTDSFHATCFSVIFNKSFFTYLQLSRSERVRSLANIGHFENRLLEPGETLNEQQIEKAFDSKSEDYNKFFAMVREQSKDYLVKALEGIRNE